jgi:hypothetical protein
MVYILKKKQPSNFTFHCFRRTAATWLAAQGISVINLKHFGRWQSDVIAQSYVANSDHMKMELAKQVFPDDSSNQPEKSASESNPEKSIPESTPEKSIPENSAPYLNENKNNLRNVPLQGYLNGWIINASCTINIDINAND